MITEKTCEKRKLQADQYQFPYHYLIDLEEQTFGRSLGWGLDYLTYMRKVAALSAAHLDGDMLDVGCGDGALLCHLARQGVLGPETSAVGIDIDEKPVKFAQAFAHDFPNVSFRVEDIADYDRAFGLVTSVETFEHIPDDHIGPFTSHIDRLLQPGGTLVVSVPSKARPVLEKHHRHYDLGMLRSYFPAYDVREVHYMTDRSHPVYHLVSTLLCYRHLSLNFGGVGRALLKLHERFSSETTAERGAHIVAVFRKPETTAHETTSHETTPRA